MKRAGYDRGRVSRRPPIDRGRFGAGSVVASGLLLLLWPVLGAAAAGPEPLEPIVDRIQRECLRAYPEELLAEMASGASEIPDEVEADPEAQMRFLDREVARDKGLFYPILLEDLLPAFRRYVGPGVRFLDLGSGDGRVVFLAEVLGARATGIEYDEELVALSRRALAALGDVVDAEDVEIVRGDFFASSWSGYDVVFYFDQSSFAQDRVREKLRRDLDRGAVLLVAYEQAPFPGLAVETAFPGRDAPHPEVKVYRGPASRSGEAANE